MLRFPLAAAILALAGCASSPPPKPATPADLLLGAWTCTNKMGETATINGTMTYAAGGATTFHINVTGGSGAFKIDAAGDGAGTWKLSDDMTQLTSSITSLNITSAKLNGSTVDPKMVQGMANQMLVGQSGATKMTVTKTTLALAQPDGNNPTSCTR
jgi:hypothetical protein